MILLQQRTGKLVGELEKLCYSNSYPISVWRMKKSAGEMPDLKAEDPEKWPALGRGQIWGGHREYYFFYTEFKVPEGCEGRILDCEIRTGQEGGWDALNPQFLAWVNGEIRQGLDVNHRRIRLTENAEKGEVYHIFLSAFSGDHNFSLVLEAAVRVLEPLVETYYYDVKVPYEVSLLLPTDSREYIQIIQGLNESLNLLDLRKKFSPEFYKSLAEAQAYLTEEFYEKKCGRCEEVIACVGHTHIDVAWLWTLAVTRDKAVRSFSTVLELMRRYPEYKFMSSQPQLYAYVKEDAPQIYEEIRQRVAEGRWEVEGGMWLEADCNIPSGESLVRQFLYGLRFFEQEFGKKNEILWLPDVFGYSAALPQIMKKCGIRYFMTTKISWNEFNQMPYDTFVWEGIDGTEVLTHFSSSRDFSVDTAPDHRSFYTTYNADLNPSMVMGNWKRYGQKELHTESLMTYGYGDGGGGPTDWMLENARRLERGIPGCPRIRHEHALPFFKKLEQDVSGNKYLPRWVGELYLEYHRGTYTTMARNKRYNRKSEFACENLEFYGTLAEALLGEKYPAALLAESWKVILRNQFHDIIPGSSIREVYEDSRAEYEQMLEKVNRETERLLGVLAGAVEGGRNSLVIFHPDSTPEKTVIEIPEKEIHGENGKCLALRSGEESCDLQKTAEGYVAVLSGLPSKGYRVFHVEERDEKNDNPMIVSLKEVETPYFRIVLNDKGQFTSIYDKISERELIPEGECANRIVSYEDKPHNYDAWDINHYYTEKSWEVDEVSSMEILENGPVRACIRMERPYLDSRIVQYLYFYRDLDRIDIRNEIDWQEEQILLRDYFPVDIHTDEAVFEIQYGNVKRPTHSNTMWDFAKFEVCAHKWLDVSEDGYGVSILNDCKYGCSVKNGVIGLSMLKSPLYPNPAADKEHHTFWYGICPHRGDFRQGGTVGKAYVFNNPPRAVAVPGTGEKSLPAVFSVVGAEADHVVIQVVKRAEEGSGTVIRLYETNNRRGKLALEVNLPFRKAWETDLLEHPEKELRAEKGRIFTEIKPYEIKTILLE